MAKVFAIKDRCLLLRCVYDILNAVLCFARGGRHFACSILGFVCKIFRKAKLKKCKQLKTPTNHDFRIGL